MPRRGSSSLPGKVPWGPGLRAEVGVSGGRLGGMISSQVPRVSKRWGQGCPETSVPGRQKKGWGWSLSWEGTEIAQLGRLGWEKVLVFGGLHFCVREMGLKIQEVGVLGWGLQMWKALAEYLGSGQDRG